MIESAHIADAISFIDEKTWVLVDLDNTLFEASQAVGHANYYYDKVGMLLQKGMSRKDALEKLYPEWLEVQETCGVQVIEEDFIPLMIALQKKGIIVIGLTHRRPIAAGITLRQVISLGFDFTFTAPSQEIFSLEAKHPTLYLQGILFVNDFNNKGEVFNSFLSKIGRRPEKVVFIDDKEANLEDLGKTLHQLKVDYIGIYYTALTEKIPPLQESKKMMRENILQLLAQITPQDSIEKEHITFAHEWVKSGVEIFRREAPARPPYTSCFLFCCSRTDLS